MERFCTKCGNKLDENDIFCSKCGMKVKTMNAVRSDSFVAEESQTESVTKKKHFQSRLLQ